MRVHSQNKRYFTDNTGKAIYLTGSHTWYIIHNSTNDSSSNNLENFKKFLDLIESHNHNFIRLWTAFSYLHRDSSPYIWQRTGPGNASDGKLKFDLKKFNSSYFSTLKSYLNEIEKRNMYYSIMFFGSHNGMKTNWTENAWHPNNNVNSELKAFSLSDGYSFFINNSGVRTIQELQIKKFIDELNNYENLLWEIMNEASDQSIDWQYDMIEYAKQYEASKPKHHLVGMSAGYSTEIEQSLELSPADFISPGNKSSAEYWNLTTKDSNGGPASYVDKIVILDTDHLWGYTESSEALKIRKWVWKTFCRGNHPIYMDNYDDLTRGGGSANTVTSWENPIRKAMGDTRSYASKFINLANMLPSDNTNICSTKFCLYDPGQEYLIYQPQKASFSVYLPNGDYKIEWFDPKDSSQGQSELSLNTGRDYIFQIPSHISEDSVLHIRFINPTFIDKPTGLKLE